MDHISQHDTPKSYLRFFGEGSTYFGIVALNLVLTILTLGVYYPWAKAAYRRYLWNETEMNESRFVFHGTGKEMFKGFVFVYIFVIAFYAIAFLGSHYNIVLLLIPVLYLVLFFLLPFIIFGTWKYKTSRTSWRGIHFYFDGNSKEFAKLFFKELFFTLITFGIYGTWMDVNIRKYLFKHTQLGKLKLGFNGDGGNLLGIILLGMLLSYVTLGIYLPIYLKNKFNFLIEHTYIEDGGNKKYLKSTLENGEAWKTIVGNFFLLIFTLGLAFPWVLMRTMRMYFNNIVLPEGLDMDNLEQSPEDYRDARGDEAADFLDLDLDIGF